ncbi:MAG: glycosyl transferase [Desulfobacteraceae bacterium 4572_87]|nr:MAG: glycosyl transferase [Desulfobacteraceae bacterium 4572_87]
MTLLTLLTLVGTFLWIIILLLPWRPGSTREFLDGEPDDCHEDLSNITVLIPARNEAAVIRDTLSGILAQGRHIKVILVDDQSEDKTASLAGKMRLNNLKIVSGRPLPDGWSGKLWALHQGFQRVDTPLVLLLDADIELKPGILSKLLREMGTRKVHLISLMAYLRMISPWERLLMPAFIYFFKLLYPFHLSNSRFRGVAAAAGGCILIRTDMLKAIGGFSAVRGELIDDCALARKVKAIGGRTWIGLSHSALSLRAYDQPGVIWNMVARTAFHQLHDSISLLLLVTGTMLLMFLMPMIGLFFPSLTAGISSLCGLSAMILGYTPTLKFYGLNWKWAFFMPLIGLLFLSMTWTSAIRFWQGKGAEWKGRAYGEKRG